ncbi:MAG: hypothetical protein IPK69_13415 [Phycisphaerales bacterium]|nr:MAG: hypothetical protein IPK69_13415 [Phycisphaerales bacterium]
MPTTLRLHSPHRLVTSSLLLAAALSACSGVALADWNENPPVMLQWFECPWNDMEHRAPDFFMAGYGSVWVPPVSRPYIWPGSSNQNATSPGYDVFDRFDLGKPNARTAYGTEAGFDAAVEAIHRANGEFYVDSILNHNAARQTGSGFQNDGGYPGFWMAPTTPATNKSPTSNWGDFNPGNAQGYPQSTNENDPNYCLLSGDLVALIDINQASNNMFIRQPVAAGNPLNLPGGTYFNNPDPNNARFYFDSALGTDSVSNPGMSFAGALTTGAYTPPCDVPARNEPSTTYTRGRFNIANATAGDPEPENATDYLMRWTQWMLDVKKVDGFRLDAAKHIPSWFWDSYFDSVMHNARITPDGRQVTAFSFGECVAGNDFIFDRYIRKPNGRTSGRLVAGDAFGNRDALDLSGAGSLRNLINAGGFGTWTDITGSHLDTIDDGFNNGSVGVNHVFSHDNGSQGNGSSVPSVPTSRQQGWFAHAYLLMRTGQSIVYHNARLVGRTGSGFYPREGTPIALGYDQNASALNPVLTNLVGLSNMVGRGEFTPRWQDGDVMIFERRTPLGGGNYSGNCLVGASDRYDSGYDQRTVNTSFPAGTRLIELTGNATSSTVDPVNDIADVLVVGPTGQVQFRVPRNTSSAGEHNLGFVVYAPAIPNGTLSVTNVASTISSETTGAVGRRRLTSVPVITADSFQIQLTTTNGDAGAANNDNADDNAVFRINQGYQDWNNSGGVDIDHTNAVVPGYEQFVTLHQPLANTANTMGQYAQTIDATQLPEGMNYISVIAFRKRSGNEAPLFREFRQVVYIDRECPTVQLALPPGPYTTTTLQATIRSVDGTVLPAVVGSVSSPGVHVLVNPNPAFDPTTLVATSNAATRVDRQEWSRAVTGLVHGTNRIVVLAVQENARVCATEFQIFVNLCPADVDDGSGTGTPDGGITIDDLLYYLSIFNAGAIGADVDNGTGTGTPDGGVTIDDLLYYLTRFNAGC